MAQPKAMVAPVNWPGKRFGGPEWFLVIGLGALAVTAALVMAHADFIAALNRQFIAWQELAVRYGYLGVFLSMFIGNLTVMVILPSSVVPFLVAAAGINPFLVGIFSGLGAFSGEFTGYLLGLLGSGLVASRYPEAYGLLKRIVARRPWAIPILLLIFSMLPLPDDVLFIPLGILGYSWWKLLLPSLGGKIIAGWFLAYGGQVTGSLLATRTFTSVSFFGQLGFLGALILFAYFLMRVPWTGVLKRFDR